MENAEPRRLDHYLLERRLAVGGMAEVFLAKDERDGRTVALKRLLPQVASDRDFLERFFHEIQIQIALKHRNIVELLDCSPDPTRPYIVMEYVDGGSLHGLRAQVGKLPWELSLFAAQEGLQGLALAHRKGIVHRDVKPHNLMWTRAGAVKLADFGISHAENMTRLTSTGSVVGTPANMSPEQARGETLDGRSDLFSMGSTIYELVVGENPFSADSVAATLRRVIETEPEPPSLLDPAVPAGLDALLHRLLAKDRGARCPSAEEASQAIRDLLSREGIGQPHDVFREFVASPLEFVRARKEKLLHDSKRRAEELLADRSAPPEEALWAAYRTVSCAPEDDSARALYQTAVTLVGQRSTPVDNARIRELEAQLRKDPGNVSLLLQLAKLYRLERDFVNVMRFFRRLQSVGPSDAYTQGQIAALVGNAPAASVPRGDHPAARKGVLPPPDPAPDASSRRGLAIASVGLVLCLAFAIWWARRPALDLSAATDGQKARAQKLVGMLRVVETPAAAPSRENRENLLQTTLEKGALVEKEQGPEKTLAFFRERLVLLAPPERPALLLAMSELAERMGDLTQAVALLDEAVEVPGAATPHLRLRKAALLSRNGQVAAAVAIWHELSQSNDPDIWRPATLQVALAADRGGDPRRALTLYDDIQMRAPDSREAVAARLGAAPIRAAQGERETARQLYEKVRQSEPPGSDLARRAEEGLLALQ